MIFWWCSDSSFIWQLGLSRCCFLTSFSVKKLWFILTCSAQLSLMAVCCNVKTSSIKRTHKKYFECAVISLKFALTYLPICIWKGILASSYYNSKSNKKLHHVYNAIARWHRDPAQSVWQSTFAALAYLNIYWTVFKYRYTDCNSHCCVVSRIVKMFRSYTFGLQAWQARSYVDFIPAFPKSFA